MTVCLEIPKALAVAEILPSCAFRASRIVSRGVSLGLPQCFPCALARAMPASLRSAIMTFSIWANPASMVSMSFPAGVARSKPSRIETTDTPYVNDFDRLYLHPMEKGFMRIVIRYGFMEDPDIPLALEQCKRFGEPFEMMETTFYVSRETVIPGVLGRRINPWRARLFAFMSKNATSATDFFKIPNNRVVELGTQLVI